MSDLPKAVQAQLDAAEALQAQLVNPAPVEGNPEVAPVTSPSSAAGRDCRARNSGDRA